MNMGLIGLFSEQMNRFESALAARALLQKCWMLGCPGRALLPTLRISWTALTSCRARASHDESWITTHVACSLPGASGSSLAQWFGSCRPGPSQAPCTWAEAVY